MSSTEVVSSFIEGSPPGELTEVVKAIKALTSDSDPALLQNPKVKAAFQRYNESQLVCAKLPGGTQHVCRPLASARPHSPAQPSSLTAKPGPGQRTQQTRRHHLLRHHNLHLLHLRPPDPKTQQQQITHPRLPPQRPHRLNI